LLHALASGTGWAFVNATALFWPKERTEEDNTAKAGRQQNLRARSLPRKIRLTHIPVTNFAGLEIA
jgi:hypothetical protein